MVTTRPLAVLLFLAGACCAGCLNGESSKEQSTEFVPPETIQSSNGESHLAIAAPKVARVDGRLLLEDIGLVFCDVAFSKPINGRMSLSFSETEITNLMFAAYLADSGLRRDDSAFVQAYALAEMRDELPHSTGSPRIDIRQTHVHWTNGSHPKGQENYPVTLVTTAQAMQFCDWLTKRYKLDGVFRLPSDEEWIEAAYGIDRKYPWGDEVRDWQGSGNEVVDARPALRTPDGLYAMWGNVSELVLSSWNGYGGKLNIDDPPMATTWLGASSDDTEPGKEPVRPRQDSWGYTHSVDSRSDRWGFRVVFAPREAAETD